MSKTITAIVLVGGRGTRLEGLTKSKSKSYVSFLGKYRIIDFCLSSLSYSHIQNVGILTQYQPYDLMKYIGNGDSWDLDVVDNGVDFLTPYEGDNRELVFQRGTANAVLSQKEYLERTDSDYILILPGDQIYKIDFNDVLNEHIKRNAKLTILSHDLDPEKDDLSRFGIMEYDSNNKLIGFEEKPVNPKTNHASLGIYLFNKKFLLDNIQKASTLLDFGHDFIPYCIEITNDIYVYEHKDFFMDIGTVKSIYDCNMYFLDNRNILQNKDERFRVYSRPFDYNPHIIMENGSVRGSIVSDGAKIDGEVIHSIISYNAEIKEGSIVENSIIFPDSKVGKNVRLKNAILDEFVEIKDNVVLEFNEPEVVDLQYLIKEGLL